MNSTLKLWQVQEARRRAWHGANIRAIARAMNTEYIPTWCAVRGQTWGSISNPPPVPVGTRAKRPTRLCQNPKCARVMAPGKQRAAGLCPACYKYSRRNGRQRDPADVWAAARIQVPDLDALWARYQAGESVAQLAAGRAFSTETLRRRFKEAGLQQRSRTGFHEVLTAAKVRQARQLVHEENWPVSKVASFLNMRYMAVYGAVRGSTWKAAGGPLPPSTRQATRRCQRCKILTTTPLCPHCRQERATNSPHLHALPHAPGVE